MIRWLTVNELEYVKDEQQTDTILHNKKYKLNGKYHHHHLEGYSIIKSDDFISYAYQIKLPNTLVVMHLLKQATFVIYSTWTVVYTMILIKLMWYRILQWTRL